MENKGRDKKEQRINTARSLENKTGSNTIRARKEVGTVQILPNANEASISDNKITKYCLNSEQKHSKEFFDVGYRQTDGDLLKADVRRGLQMNSAKLSDKSTDEVKKYTVDMVLGITKKKTFRTIWWNDSENGFRLITAHRI